MSIQLISAVQEDLREAMAYYLETADTRISLEFYEEFQHFAELAAKSPLSFRIYSEDPIEIEGLISNDFHITFFLGKLT